MAQTTPAGRKRGRKPKKHVVPGSSTFRMREFRERQRLQMTDSEKEEARRLNSLATKANYMPMSMLNNDEWLVTTAKMQARREIYSNEYSGER